MTKSYPVGITYAKLRNKHYVICMTNETTTNLYDVIVITSSTTDAHAKPGDRVQCKRCVRACVVADDHHQP